MINHLMWVKTQGGLLRAPHLAVCWGGVGLTVNDRTLIVISALGCGSAAVPLASHVEGSSLRALLKPSVLITLEGGLQDVGSRG